MVNIVSTTTPAASNAQAMTLKALQQRMAEQQAQEAAISRPHVVTSIPQGLGDIANTFFNNRRADYLQGQEKITRDTLAKMRAGWGPTGPTQAQAAEYSALDPEEGNRVGDQAAQYAQAQATQNALFGHQTSEREATQGFQHGEREATQGFQTGERKDSEAFTKDQTPVYKDLPDEYKTEHNLPLGAKVDQFGHIQVPNVGIEGQPLQPTQAVTMGAAGDFVQNAGALQERARAGEGTGLFAGALGQNELRNQVNEAVETYISIQGLDPKSEEADAVRRQYGTVPNMSAQALSDKIGALAGALKIAHKAVKTGRTDAAVPGGEAETTPAPGAAGIPMPNTEEELKVGQSYTDGKRSMTYKGKKPGTAWNDPANWE